MDRIKNTAELAEQYAQLSANRRAYLAGYMDGLAFLAESAAQEAKAGAEGRRKAMAAGPSEIR